MSSRLSGYTVAGNIRKAVEKLGDEISAFKAYVDIHQESLNKARTQVELQASGVTFVHCPHNSRKEVADRVLLGEHPSTIIQISSGYLSSLS